MRAQLAELRYVEHGGCTLHREYLTSILYFMGPRSMTSLILNIPTPRKMCFSEYVENFRETWLTPLLLGPAGDQLLPLQQPPPQHRHLQVLSGALSGAKLVLNIDIKC